MEEIEKKIKYQRSSHKGEERILLDIPFDDSIIEKVKMIPGRKWSQSKKCWHLPDNSESMRYIHRLIQLYDEATPVEGAKVKKIAAATLKAIEMNPTKNDLPKSNIPEAVQKSVPAVSSEQVYL